MTRGWGKYVCNNICHMCEQMNTILGYQEEKMWSFGKDSFLHILRRTLPIHHTNISEKQTCQSMLRLSLEFHMIKNTLIKGDDETLTRHTGCTNENSGIQWKL
jgi:hypothetical protein